jgi:hypothetical protein
MEADIRGRGLRESGLSIGAWAIVSSLNLLEPGADGIFLPRPSCISSCRISFLRDRAGRVWVTCRAGFGPGVPHCGRSARTIGADLAAATCGALVAASRKGMVAIAASRAVPQSEASTMRRLVIGVAAAGSEAMALAISCSAAMGFTRFADLVPALAMASSSVPVCG